MWPVPPPPLHHGHSDSDTVCHHHQHHIHRQVHDNITPGPYYHDMVWRLNGSNIKVQVRKIKNRREEGINEWVGFTIPSCQHCKVWRLITMLCSGHRCGHDLHCGGGQEDRLQDKEQEAVEGGGGCSVSSSQVMYNIFTCLHEYKNKRVLRIFQRIFMNVGLTFLKLKINFLPWKFLFSTQL